MRLALFGGTFDPIHKGHLEIIRKLFTDLKMDQVILIPTNITYYRKAPLMFTYLERLELCKKAISNDGFLQHKKIIVSDLEKEILPTEGFYTTLLKVEKAYKDTEIFTVIGSDSYNNFATWRNYQTILNNSTLIVAKRPGIEIKSDPLIPYQVLDLNYEDSSTSLRLEIEKSILAKLK